MYSLGELVQSSFIEAAEETLQYLVYIQMRHKRTARQILIIFNKSRVTLIINTKETDFPRRFFLQYFPNLLRALNFRGQKIRFYIKAQNKRPCIQCRSRVTIFIPLPRKVEKSRSAVRSTTAVGTRLIREEL